MIHHNGKVFAFELEDKLYELYRIKTVRKHKIYVDKFGQYYASWNDFWHVFNNLEASMKNHWSIYKPKFIHQDHKRFISKEFAKFKSSTKTENWDLYLESWDQWEKLLHEDEQTLEVNLTEVPNSKKLNYIGFHYSKFNSIGKLIEYIEEEYIKDLIPSPSYNINWFLINTYTGQKIINGENLTLEEAGILPGSILFTKII